MTMRWWQLRGRALLASWCLIVVACSRLPSQRAPREVASTTNGGPPADASAYAEFVGHFSDVLACDKMARTAWLERKPTETDSQEYVLIGVDDGRILDRASTPPRAFAGPDHSSPFHVTSKHTPTWEADGTDDVCFSVRSMNGSSKNVKCFTAVSNARSRCDGGVCTLFANANAGPIVFALVKEGTGDVWGEGYLNASSLDGVATEGMRVALRFGVSQAVIDLGAKKVFERIPVPDERGEVHGAPLVWFGDDELLSCEVDPRADRRRPCRRIVLLALADERKWRAVSAVDFESGRFQFAARRDASIDESR